MDFHSILKWVVFCFIFVWGLPIIIPLLDQLLCEIYHLLKTYKKRYRK